MNFHTIIYPDNSVVKGLMPTVVLNKMYSNISLPKLYGKTVLDVGAADGYYSFRMAEDGASVTSVNNVIDFHINLITHAVNKKLQHKVTPVLGSVYDIDMFPQNFDIICMMGLIYHLKHPLLAINLAYKKCNSLVVIETEYFDDDHNSDLPYMKFLPNNELNNDGSNWWVPNVECIISMMKSAGFTTVKVIQSTVLPRKRIILHGCK